MVVVGVWGAAVGVWVVAVCGAGEEEVVVSVYDVVREVRVRVIRGGRRSFYRIILSTKSYSNNFSSQIGRNNCSSE